eukprot:NODE_3363_length_1365_cov_41.199678_g2927_i0.p1 GENE.NODE_3363_length_1365_cov_41.199678_g2927_i0~~NODE_3363_length_1365_cov_41.199678_g2927_i0.p1  ORF type:complete len:379 (+),score=60.29 NODE_3363_length_1365_cov_41.199678_g2927_i0:55-1191(+)
MADTAPSAQDQSRSEDQQDNFEKSSDFANYFCTYEFLYHQKQMLEDQKRMAAYHSAIMQNKDLFKGKVVLDVGAGSGILSIWAAQAGALKVYGVEATRVANNARILIEAQGLSDRVEIIQSTMEDVTLPCKVDIIISEWMGYFLLRESMLDSVLVARDKFLKPGGALYPSHAKIFVAPVYTDDAIKKHASYQEAMQDWTVFVRTTKNKYGVDMECLTSAFRNEQWEYYLQTAQWADLSGHDVVGQSSCVLDLNLNTLKLEEYKSFSSTFTCPLKSDTRISSFGSWFTTTFEGSEENQCKQPYVVLDTAPGSGTTHWGQQVFSLYPPVSAMRGDIVTGSIHVKRKKENQRLLVVQISHSIKKPTGAIMDGPATNTWQIM